MNSRGNAWLADVPVVPSLIFALGNAAAADSRNAEPTTLATSYLHAPYIYSIISIRNPSCEIYFAVYISTSKCDVYGVLRSVNCMLVDPSIALRVSTPYRLIDRS